MQGNHFWVEKRDILQKGALTFFWAEFAHRKLVIFHNDSQGPVEIACGSAQLLCLSLQDAPLRHQLLVFCREVAEGRCLSVHHYTDYGENEKETAHQSVDSFSVIIREALLSIILHLTGFLTTATLLSVFLDVGVFLKSIHEFEYECLFTSCHDQASDVYD